MSEDEDLLQVAEEIDNLLLETCIKHQVGFETITAIVLARIVAISQQIHSESDTGRLLSLAQSSIMESGNQTPQ